MTLGILGGGCTLGWVACGVAGLVGGEKRHGQHHGESAMFRERANVEKGIGFGVQRGGRKRLWVAAGMAACVAATPGWGGGAEARAGICYGIRKFDNVGSIIRFDTAIGGASVTTIATHAPWGASGVFPQGMDFGPDGNLYVLTAAGVFTRVNPDTGAVTMLPSIPQPTGAIGGTGTQGFFQDLARNPVTGELEAIFVRSGTGPNVTSVHRVNITNSTTTPIANAALVGSPGLSIFAQGYAIDSLGRRFFDSDGSLFTLGELGTAGAGPNQMPMTRIGAAGGLGSGQIYGLTFEHGVAGTGGVAGWGPGGSDVLYAGRSQVFRVEHNATIGPTVLSLPELWDLAFRPVPAPSTAGGILGLVCGMGLVRRRR